jgi:hypothetical protein
MRSLDTGARPPGRFGQSSRGQSMVEYLVVATIVLALVALPFGDSNSVLALMLDAIRTAYQKFLAAVSLPQ